MTSNLRLIWTLLSPQQRKRAGWLFVLMVGGMVLEMIGIALIIPFFAVLGADDLPFGLSFQDPTAVALIALSLLLGFYIFKSAYLAFFNWSRAQYVFQLQADLSDWILGQFLKQPIEFHFQNHSTELGRQALHDTSQFARGAVMSTMTIAAEGLVFIGIFGFLFAYQPIYTITIVGSFSLTAAGFYAVWRQRLYRWGRERQTSEGEAHRCMHESITAIREVKVSHNETAFIQRYSDPSHQFATIASKQSTLEALPRIGLELLTVIGISILAGGLMLQGTALNSLVPTIALFAVATSRMLPSVSRILNHLSYLRFSAPIVKSISGTISELSQYETATSQDQPSQQIADNWNSITVEGLSYTYPSRSEPALKDTSLRITRGERIAIVGPTGSGKSTLIDILLGLLEPSQGQATVDTVPLIQAGENWHRIIGYVPQHPVLLDDTLARNIAFGIPTNEIDSQALEEAIATAQLSRLVATLELGLETRIGERGNRLSGGQCQRVAIARALYKKPQVITPFLPHELHPIPLFTAFPPEANS
ncbi:ABC transporter ATP-binding protein/permease [Akkermansiaceae bacterium]|nr:ABC transporter ATP-binding protein/permease [Akkermansiaceae bacterium]MDB4748365.1 ABC transporter ATP-binding protein/permease [Akkermansiaceae bacterium]